MLGLDGGGAARFTARGAAAASPGLATAADTTPAGACGVIPGDDMLDWWAQHNEDNSARADGCRGSLDARCAQALGCVCEATRALTTVTSAGSHSTIVVYTVLQDETSHRSQGQPAGPSTALGDDSTHEWRVTNIRREVADFGAAQAKAKREQAALQ